jgi:hypothetical protein
MATGNAESAIANGITQELRKGWRTHTFDRLTSESKGGHFRVTAATVSPPHVHTENYVRGVTDPEADLCLPPYAFELAQWTHDTTLRTFPPHEQAEYREWLRERRTLPYKRSRNRHGTMKYRRNDDTTATVVAVCLKLARSCYVVQLDEHEYHYHLFGAVDTPIPVVVT